MKNNKIKQIILIVLGIVLIFIWVSYNLCFNKSFFEASLSNILGISVAVIFSYMFVQRQTDLRKQKEVVVRILESIIEIVTDDNAYRLDEQEKENILLRNRRLKNKIALLKGLQDILLKKDDVERLENYYNNYVGIIDDHNFDKNELKNFHLELQRQLNNIDTISFEIMKNIYK